MKQNQKVKTTYAGWEPGIYIVQVTIGKEVMSDKIITK